MRHAVLSSPVSSSSDPSSSSSDANVLEHLIEFIQYAYTHYSQLFEDPAVTLFRAAWIEQLGDLARYRMAVAGLASRVHAAQQSASSGGGLTASALDEGAKKPRPADAASIGQAALGDWDLEEQETWKEMARDWYGQGVAENPGTGRLQHHLALLSKGDELRSLYHYAKRCVRFLLSLPSFDADYFHLAVSPPLTLTSPLASPSSPFSKTNIKLVVLSPTYRRRSSSSTFTACSSPKSLLTTLTTFSVASSKG
jgi:hypothetical protein